MNLLLDTHAFICLWMAINHIQKLLSLDLRHRDPFDRIIISQGLSEDLTIITKDDISLSILANYYGFDLIEEYKKIKTMTLSDTNCFQTVPFSLNQDRSDNMTQ